MLYNLVLFTLSLISRFIGLKWGNGFHFHPDENNMAWAIERLSWPEFNPEFFAYGQFPLYLTYFTRPKPINFHQAAIGLRFWSAAFSIFTIIIGYFLAKNLFESKFWARIYSLLLIFTPGLIQMAHFGTTESILTFVGLSMVLISLKYLKTGKWKFLVVGSLISAIGLGSKLNAGLFLFPMILAIFNQKNIFKRLFLYGGLTFVLTLIFSPYYMLEFQEVLRIFNYEANLARGVSSIFYTRQFINTTPFWFQLNKVFPWILGLPMYLFLGVSLFVLVFKLSKMKFGQKLLNLNLIFLLAGFLPWFVFNGLLFTKWTRFMTPILPFLILLVVWGIKELFNSHPELDSGSLSKIIFANFTIPKRVRNDGLLYLVLFLFVLPGIIYSQIYFRPDIRIKANQWMNRNLPSGTTILYEGGNVIDLPKLDQAKFETVSVDFYRLENNPQEQAKLEEYLNQADYYLMPSRRMFANYLRLPQKYPYAFNLYNTIFSNEEFELIKKFTPFGPLGQILLGPDILAEETWTVFDHPTLRLFKIN